MQTRLATLVLACILTACSAGELSRSKAAQLIRSDPKFSQDFGMPIVVGRLCSNPHFLYSRTRLREAERVGLVTISKRQSAVRCPGFLESGVDIALTEAGKSAAKNWAVSPTLNELWAGKAESATEYLVRTGNRELVEVTGVVSDAQRKLADVDFTWRWSPVADPTGIVEQPYAAGELHEEQYTFVKYDDGWRVHKRPSGWQF